MEVGIQRCSVLMGTLMRADDCIWKTVGIYICVV